MKLKVIIDDTSPFKARVVNAETGEQLKATRVDVHVDMNTIPRLTVEVLDFEAEI